MKYLFFWHKNMVPACKANVWLEKRGLWSPWWEEKEEVLTVRERWGPAAVLAILFPDGGAAWVQEGASYAFPQALCLRFVLFSVGMLYFIKFKCKWTKKDKVPNVNKIPQTTITTRQWQLHRSCPFHTHESTVKIYGSKKFKEEDPWNSKQFKPNQNIKARSLISNRVIFPCRCGGRLSKSNFTTTLVPPSSITRGKVQAVEDVYCKGIWSLRSLQWRIHSPEHVSGRPRAAGRTTLAVGFPGTRVRIRRMASTVWRGWQGRAAERSVLGTHGVAFT